MIILGVDPGYGRLGLAVVEKHSGAQDVLLYSTCVITPKNLSFPERLVLIGQACEQAIKDYQPDRVAIETLFFSKNQKTALAVAATRGVIMYVAANHELPVIELSPIEVKLAIAGFGRADKKQISQMTERLIKLEAKPRLDDEYDAMAVALTALAKQSLKN